VPDHYDDGGLSGASLDRPALQALLAEVGARKIDVVVVYKVDRLTRSLADFAKLIELFDAHAVSFVSVTQSFNTTTSIMPSEVLCRADADFGRKSYPDRRGDAA
jgi:site-specific DNA recombinase